MKFYEVFKNVIESMEKDRGLPLRNRMQSVLICNPYAVISNMGPCPI